MNFSYDMIKLSKQYVRDTSIEKYSNFIFKCSLDAHELKLFRYKFFNINKYYVMNYSINSFTGASEAPVNVAAVY